MSRTTRSTGPPGCLVSGVSAEKAWVTMPCLLSNAIVGSCSFVSAKGGSVSDPGESGWRREGIARTVGVQPQLVDSRLDPQPLKFEDLLKVLRLVVAHPDTPHQALLHQVLQLGPHFARGRASLGEVDQEEVEVVHPEVGE